MILKTLLLILLSSCALFQTEKSLKEYDKLELLEAVKLNGEGRGRLTLGGNQYVFSFESDLLENFDWVLGVSIPLQGEEILLIPNLRKKYIRDSKVESFQARISADYKRLKLHKILSSDEFMTELRSILRFKLAKKLDLHPRCQEKDSCICELDDEKFFITVRDKEFLINKKSARGAMIVMSGSVLDDSSFMRTDIRLYSSNDKFLKAESDFSLELFWKN